MTSRRLERLLEALKYDWHFRFVEMYRRGGRYYDSEVVDISDFHQLYISWEFICGISQFDCKSHREQNCEELGNRYLSYDECRDIGNQYGWYYVITKNDEIQYEEEDDAWIDREFLHEHIEY